MNAALERIRIKTLGMKQARIAYNTTWKPLILWQGCDPAYKLPAYGQSPWKAWDCDGSLNQTDTEAAGPSHNR